ncbi:Ig-like domain-containing protein [Duffyella gerundensis]|uniref:Ig-like domain-containing protein n=1 Tax=Duffyella gerundensis TaxID=1619313 RepID=UPI00165443C3|nr:Ig-like domain-containing protein [Duffyella gerundensis]
MSNPFNINHGTVFHTNDPFWTLPLDGKDAANGRVEVYINGKKVDFVIDENDKYVIDFNQPLPEGKHVVTVMTFDPAGNPSLPGVFLLDVDYTPPVKPEILRVVDDSGADPYYLTSGEVTKDGAPVLTGSGEPGTKVKLMNGTEEVGEVEVDSLGRWQFTPELKEGTNTFTVVSIDKAGNQSESDPFNIYLNEKPADAPEEIARQPVTQDTAPVVQEEETPVDPIPGAMAPVLSRDGVLTFDGYLVDPQDEGATVHVVVDGVIYSTTIKDLQWSLAALQLEDGLHVVDIRYTDLAKNPGIPTQFLFEVDKTPPEQPVILQVYDDVNGRNLSPMGSTNDTTPTLVGVSEPHSVVYVYRGDRELGSVEADANGRWEFDTSTVNLTGSSHQFKVKAQDKYERESIFSDTFPVNFDIAPPQKPTIGGASDDVGTPTELVSNSRTDDDRPTFRGQAENGSLVTIYVNGEAVASTYADAMTGNWSLDAPLEAGENIVTVVAKDSAGNESEASDEFVLTLAEDPNQPLIGGLFNNDGDVPVAIANGADTNDKTPLLTGEGVDGDIIKVFLDGEEIGSTTVKDGEWSFELPEIDGLQDGEHALTITVTDEFDQTSDFSEPFEFNLDTQAPVSIDIGAGTVVDNEGNPIVEGEKTGDDKPTFTGEGTDGDLITIVDQDNNPIGSAIVEEGRWEITPEEGLDTGEYDLGIIVTDPAGNESEKSEDPFKLIVDTTPPDNLTDVVLSDNVGPITDPLTGDPARIDDPRPEFSGRGEAGSSVIIIVDYEEVGTVQVNDDGEWSWQPADDLEEGIEHSFVAQPVDEVGNRGEATAPINIIVDTSPVSLSALVVSDNEGIYQNDLVSGDKTDDTTPTFSGSATDGSTVFIVDKLTNTIIGSVQVNNGSWTFTPEAPLDQGNYELEIYAQSPYGVQSAKTEFNFTVDLSTPEAPAFGTDFDIWDDVGSITGKITQGGETDDVRPEFKGTAEKDEVIFIYADGDTETAIASIKVDESGEWSWMPDTDLGEGEHSYQVAIRDAAGNMGAISEAIEFTVDVSAPLNGRMEGIWTNIGGSNSSILPDPDGEGEYIAQSKDNSPVFSGRGEIGTLVTIYDKDNGNAVASGYVQDTERWRIETIELQDATYNFAIEFSDAAGNTETIDVEFPVKIDTTPPGPPITAPIPETRGLFEIDEQGAALSVNDVLQQGQQDLFINSGTTQLMVTGKSGAVLNLEDLTNDQNEWQQANGSVTVGGVEYNVFQSAGKDVELLVQQDLNTQL